MGSRGRRPPPAGFLPDGVQDGDAELAAKLAFEEREMALSWTQWRLRSVEHVAPLRPDIASEFLKPALWMADRADSGLPRAARSGVAAEMVARVHEVRAAKEAAWAALLAEVRARWADAVGGVADPLMGAVIADMATLVAREAAMEAAAAARLQRAARKRAARLEAAATTLQRVARGRSARVAVAMVAAVLGAAHGQKDGTPGVAAPSVSDFLTPLQGPLGRLLSSNFTAATARAASLAAVWQKDGTPGTTAPSVATMLTPLQGPSCTFCPGTTAAAVSAAAKEAKETDGTLVRTLYGDVLRVRCASGVHFDVGLSSFCEEAPRADGRARCSVSPGVDMPQSYPHLPESRWLRCRLLRGVVPDADVFHPTRWLGPRPYLDTLAGSFWVDTVAGSWAVGANPYTLGVWDWVRRQEHAQCLAATLLAETQASREPRVRAADAARAAAHVEEEASWTESESGEEETWSEEEEEREWQDYVRGARWGVGEALRAAGASELVIASAMANWAP